MKSVTKDRACYCHGGCFRKPHKTGEEKEQETITSTPVQPETLKQMACFNNDIVLRISAERRNIRMDEEFVEFLRYGLSQTIKKKDIFVMNFMMMFFSLFLILADGYPSLKWGIVSITPVMVCIILTYTKEDIKGNKIFFIYGVLGTCLAWIFGLSGIRLMFFVLDKESRFIFISILFALYVIVMGIYVYIIKNLIKKRAYKETRKMNGKLSFIIVGIGGISVAKTFANSVGYERSIQIISICAFLASFLSLLGIFGFFKYYYLRKLDELN